MQNAVWLWRNGVPRMLRVWDDSGCWILEKAECSGVSRKLSAGDTEGVG